MFKNSMLAFLVTLSPLALAHHLSPDQNTTAEFIAELAATAPAGNVVETSFVGPLYKDGSNIYLIETRGGIVSPVQTDLVLIHPTAELSEGALTAMVKSGSLYALQGEVTKDFVHLGESGNVVVTFHMNPKSLGEVPLTKIVQERTTDSLVNIGGVISEQAKASQVSLSQYASELNEQVTPAREQVMAYYENSKASATAALTDAQKVTVELVKSSREALVKRAQEFNFSETIAPYLEATKDAYNNAVIVTKQGWAAAREYAARKAKELSDRLKKQEEKPVEQEVK